ncbi:P63C domain-containing protein [Cyclobacterium plantarum]|uniref:Bacteriophage Mx8 p63 C-terminal domain-containing protein n=1 Tax=Cyclobacterium plantarum TaxID=2716263 RepID=A0ABX0H3U6_9BACT|nr:P63C domain-containing protein [Cyclobacterium plantarum]NHE56488.1 hypothetical protein [Cyclobacterium plantarum]
MKKDELTKKPVSEEVSKKVEITKEAEQERKFLSGMLIQKTEDLVEEAKRRKREKEEEKFELRNGTFISIAELREIITANLQPYKSHFPNTQPFFSEIYRLNEWTDLNPNDYIKPPIVGTWINEIIYSRYSKEVLPALRILNPSLPSGIRKFKHFQFLTEEGQNKLNQFRDEAIALMKESKSWIEFRRKLLQKHGVPYQSEMFDK